MGVDPVSLGILAAPGTYGADIVVGSIQPLGIHMNCGGGLGGFIASRDEPRYAHEYPTLMISIAQSTHGEYGFGMALMHQMLLRLARRGQGLDRQLYLSMGHRQRRVHVGAGT